MTSLRSSAHYAWSTSWVLGRGATSTVYQGVNKNTGDPVAVKTFHHTPVRPVDIQMREFEVLKKLNHENIVKMLAVEEEAESHKKVLIMELCTGGSLYNLLDDPQNSYGLEESEFLCVLKDLSAGMKYLRDNSIIHRDLKPGNIMKFTTEDGKSVYKLIDFGAARELEDDQQFQSLYGTEEYLFPGMFETAVLKHPLNKFFRASVDLWSIGVTLYHIATGSLPFRPYGGRKNRETMHYITTKKASGVISGVQYSDNGPIEWSTELPKTCLLNQGLRELVTFLLAGILECSEEKVWSFDRFFDTVTDIINRRVIHVFYMNEGKEVSLYLQPNKLLKDVKDQIATQIKVPPNNQILLLDKSLFDNTVDAAAEVTAYPPTSCSYPLILLHNENTDIKDLTRLGTVSACFPMMHAISNVEHDAALAKTCCSVAYAIKRLVEKFVRCRDLLLKTPIVLLSLITDNVTKLCNNLDYLNQRVEGLNQRFNGLEKRYSLISEFLECWPSDHACEGELWSMKQLVFEKRQQKEQFSQKFTSLQSAVQTIKQKVLISSLLQNEWDETMADCPPLTGCVEKTHTYVNKIRDSWQALVRDKNMKEKGVKSFTFHDEQFHNLEKVKIQQTSKKLLSLLQEKCFDSCIHASHKLDEWYSGMQASMVQCKCLNEDLSSIEAVAEQYSSSIDGAEVEAEKLNEKILSQLKSAKSSEVSPPKENLPNSVNSIRIDSCKSNCSKRSSICEVYFKLQDLSESHSSLKDIVNENDSLIERLINERHYLGKLVSKENGVVDN